ncbi:hypothetical protein [Hyphomonas beringensis]|nr:hypothetical protein [Hyphomonas beringensis]
MDFIDAAFADTKSVQAFVPEYIASHDDRTVFVDVVTQVKTDHV